MSYLVPYAQRFQDDNNKCTINFNIIIPRENTTIYKVTVRHFQIKHKILPLDGKWNKFEQSASSICNVYLMQRDQSISINTNLSNAYQFPHVNKVMLDLSAYSMRQKLTSSDITNFFEIDEEDEYELEEI